MPSGACPPSSTASSSLGGSAKAADDARSEETCAEVQCMLPGVNTPVAKARLSAGSHRLADIGEALGLMAPLLGLLPAPGATPLNGQGQPPEVVLQAGMRYTAVLGSTPLIRFTEGTHVRPTLCEEGLWLLRHLPDPVHVAVFIGLGRCGKSTICSALAREAADMKDANDLEFFPVANGPYAVTSGADVAALPSESGSGCLLLVDCEGGDNALSEDSSCHSRMLATLWFAVAAQVTFCDVDLNVKMSSIEFLAAAAEWREQIKTNEENGARRYWPKLSLLVNKSDHDWKEKDIQELLKDKHKDKRNEMRGAIRNAFGTILPIRGLPNFRERGQGDVWDRGIKKLYSDLCQTTPASAVTFGLDLSGSQLAETLTRLCGEVARHGSVEPDTIYAQIVRRHLQNVVDACAEKYQQDLPTIEHYCDPHELFVNSPYESDASLRQRVLENFDCETRRITGSAKEEARSSLEAQLSESYTSLMRRNVGFKDMETERTSSIALVLIDAFRRLLPERKNGRFESGITIENLQQMQRDQLEIFDSQVSGLRCHDEVKAARTHLETQLNGLLSDVQKEFDVESKIREAIDEFAFPAVPPALPVADLQQAPQLADLIVAKFSMQAKVICQEDVVKFGEERLRKHLTEKLQSVTEANEQYKRNFTKRLRQIKEMHSTIGSLQIQHASTSASSALKLLLQRFHQDVEDEQGAELRGEWENLQVAEQRQCLEADLRSTSKLPSFAWTLAKLMFLAIMIGYIAWFAPEEARSLLWRSPAMSFWNFTMPQPAKPSPTDSHQADRAASPLHEAVSTTPSPSTAASSTPSLTVTSLPAAPATLPIPPVVPPKPVAPCLADCNDELPSASPRPARYSSDDPVAEALDSNGEREPTTRKSGGTLVWLRWRLWPAQLRQFGHQLSTPALCGIAGLTTLVAVAEVARQR